MNAVKKSNKRCKHCSKNKLKFKIKIIILIIMLKIILPLEVSIKAVRLLFQKHNNNKILITTINVINHNN